jgi:ABC-type nitrate/sulfonate/bicarbonate transport system ATPase subunit
MGTEANGALIDLRDVVKTYKTGAGSLTVLKKITLQVYPGEFVSVVGPSVRQVYTAEHDHGH